VRHVRLSLLVSVAMLGLAAVGSPAAFAEPEFEGGGGGLTGSGGKSLLTASGGATFIECEGSSSTALGISSLSINALQFVFHGCKSSGEGGSGCTVKSVPVGPAGLIVTNSLKGELGLILPKSTKGTGVGLLILPASGSITTILENACTPETHVTGSLAAEVGPIRTATLALALKVTGLRGTQLIKAIDLSRGGLALPLLSAFGTEAIPSFEELLKLGKDVEVT
jgi:hypothetical protein